MKKLISILTLASFSLVPITSTIACQSNEEKEEIVGETIDQEILDVAIKEINLVSVIKDAENIKIRYDNPDMKGIVPNLEKKPEFIIMYYILIACRNILKEKSDNQIIKKLDLNLNPDHYQDANVSLKLNLNKFKVIPNDETWFEDLKTVLGNSKAKIYQFKLKFGKTLSKETIKIKLYWTNKEN